MSGSNHVWRPATEQEIADAHDTAEYVLGYYVRAYAMDQFIKVAVTGLRPTPYVPVEDGWVHWKYPDRPPEHWVWPWWRENHFAFELTGNFVRRPEHLVRQELENIARAARAAGARNVEINHGRRGVTGTYLFLPDHAVVQHVRATGNYPFVRGPQCTPVPAHCPPYAQRIQEPQPAGERT